MGSATSGVGCKLLASHCKSNAHMQQDARNHVPLPDAKALERPSCSHARGARREEALKPSSPYKGLADVREK